MSAHGAIPTRNRFKVRPRQRGASLFVILLVCIAIVAAALFGLPWLNNKLELRRVERMEADIMRGTPPPSSSSQPPITPPEPKSSETPGTSETQASSLKVQPYPSEAEAKVEAERVAEEQAFVRRMECKEQRRVLAQYRTRAMTDGTAQDRKQVEKLKAIIAANC
ncbi:MAG: hypothetical protein H7Y02_01815 [Candidatus Obscuribacterales bacterium]|nr:hypothetical protein [Steroidobacteraceae bacterium]